MQPSAKDSTLRGQNLARLQELDQITSTTDFRDKTDASRSVLLHCYFSRLDNPGTGSAEDCSRWKWNGDHKCVQFFNNLAEEKESEKWVSGVNRWANMEPECFESFIKMCQVDTSVLLPTHNSDISLTALKEVPMWQQPAVKPSAPSFLFKAARVPAAPHTQMQEMPNGQWPQPQGPAFKAQETAFRSFGKTNNAREEENQTTMNGPGHNSNRGWAFRTARDQLAMEQSKKYGQDRSQTTYSYGASKKSLGTRRGPNNKFVPPVISKNSEGEFGAGTGCDGPRSDPKLNGSAPVDERLKGIDPKIIELITSEIMEHKPQMDWDDIAGLLFAKKTIQEIVVWPMLRPDIFTGLRGPPKGLLLFGPPGTGKTLIGKCIASQSKSTFFCISASSLTSKWVGEGEKMVRALFAVARCHQPAVIFIDEVDSLLSQRSDGEHEASRRIKTEFLVQLDGASTQSDDRILVVGATNRPQEIDEAARRRFVKRLYIPLPETVARQHIVTRLMSQQRCCLSDEDIAAIGLRTEGFSGADMASLCREAALGPIRSIPVEQMEFIQPEQVPPITMRDFEAALQHVRPSVSTKDLDVYISWNNTYGSFSQ